MKYYTGVGSRSTPQDVGELIEKLAFKFATEGYTLRSGGADGADSYFENGAKEYLIRSPKQMYDIYIPWNNFSGRKKGLNYLVASEYSTFKEAKEIAASIHPAWDRCSDGAKALHTRNVYQVLGHNLDSPSSFLIAYAEPTKSGVKGGTNTAWMLVKKFSVPCFNLYVEEDKNRLVGYLK